MRREEERWYRARLLGDYRTLGKERGRNLNGCASFAGLVAMDGGSCHRIGRHDALVCAGLP